MTSFEEKRANYIPRNPVEIVLSSKNGTQIGDLDGKKVYELESEVIARKDERILLYLKKAFIPFSFYTISASQNNNKLDVKETNSLGATNIYVVTIEDGNYSIATLLTEIKTQMEANTTFSYTYTISYNENTSKVSFLIATGTNITKTELLFSTGANKSDSLLRVLGFSEADKEFTNSITLKSDYVVDMADGLDSLRCLSNLVGDNIVSTKEGQNGGELLTIPVSLSPYSILYFDEVTNPFKHKIAFSSIKSIEITFSDGRGNTVDFNNIPYTLILICEFQFDPNSAITTQNKTLNQAPPRNIIQDEEMKKQMLKMLMNKNNKI
tara:strand:- start:570 stop:1541 length:972 start_codon:yes stop_codon:yes gene_type:complete